MEGGLACGKLVLVSQLCAIQLTDGVKRRSADKHDRREKKEREESERKRGRSWALVPTFHHCVHQSERRRKDIAGNGSGRTLSRLYFPPGYSWLTAISLVCCPCLTLFHGSVLPPGR